MAETRGKRGFSVELKSNEYVKSLNLSREGRESVLVEEVLERARSYGKCSPRRRRLNSV